LAELARRKRLRPGSVSVSTAAGREVLGLFDDVDQESELGKRGPGAR